MSKYIDAEKLIAEIERMRKINRKAFEADHIKSDIFHGRTQAINHLFEFITSLQQEQPETDIKSPFTGGKVTILSREEEVTFRGEKVKILRKYYRCEDTGREFTNDKLDDDMMWAVFRAYCEKKGITSFTDIMLKQEQPEVELEEYLSAKLFLLGADLIRHKPYSFNRGLNVGMTKAYDDILKKINVRKEE